jgi:hypothetical protein
MFDQSEVPEGDSIPPMSGGVGSASYGTSVYGNAGSQHAGPNGSIAVNHPSSYMSGGRKRCKSRRGSRRGGVGIAELAVPVGLAAANYYMGHRRSMGNRILPYMNMPGDMARKTGRFLMRSPNSKSRRRMSMSRRRSGGRSMNRSRSHKRRRSGDRRNN